jgi:hypothetical protein
MLREKIVQHVMFVDPVVKAVHAPASATAADRYVLGPFQDFKYLHVPFN